MFSPRTPFRPALSPRIMALIAAAYVLVVLNGSFLRIAGKLFAAHPALATGLAIALGAAYAALLTALSFPRLFKPLLILFITIAAAAAYFMDTFGTVIDRDMIANTVTTTTNEARHLITPALGLHMALYAGLPAALILWIREKRGTFLRDALVNMAMIAALTGVAATVLMRDYAAYAAVFRERADLVFSINPGGPIGAAVKYVVHANRERNIAVAPIGQDAKPGPGLASAQRPVFFVIVAGETLRSASFGMEGYRRDTTPELRKAGVIDLGPATSCGTATAVSLPCMFSRYGRDDYTDRHGLDHENLLDVLVHAGFHVEWWDNNTGDKAIAKRIFSQNLSRVDDPRHCSGGECNDGIFLDRLRATIDKATGNTVIVIHQIGSHGPAYYRRYPADFGPFKPDCRSVQFSDCSQEEIVNAYDNTVAFTDHFLASVIAMQKKFSDRLLTGLIFASDHGESLGENGLYLHGAPYLFAPDVQTHVPFLAWFSPEFSSALGLDTACLAALPGRETSHDDLFHSVLGVLDVQTAERKPALDLFGPCRGKDHRPVALAAPGNG